MQVEVLHNMATKRLDTFEWDRRPYYLVLEGKIKNNNPVGLV